MKNGPIILVEDDVDDQELIIEALKVLKVSNEVKTFDDGQKAIEFLTITEKQPFIILSDVNMPIVNGFQLKHQIEKSEYLRSKCIPFIFLSTTAASKAVKEAFDLGVQGFFVKEVTYEGIRQQLRSIIEYWTNCKHPNSRPL